ncbi:regulation of nuclear pre-mRNA domain-containing protein 2a isoform X1 [Pleuronectes platessa]|uniref:regulation of nuclear pre-mRNA domain-containing protein 2a isoform X1 n=1 Tax=Pleuronectes platessa TaxID=8262 RepID=UPI00232A4C96|nr:regulation of nuclear pre-mRNA domain-containing protein 2a isoform X1 [Pleuronectes platessa]
MAAGAGAAFGGSLEATLARKFQGVTSTMDSIQGLSTWCIDNKKYHSVIVRHWMRFLKKSDAPHRLNLFYLANDVIQNCKRKNATVYRAEFAEVLPEAFGLVNQEGDAKVINKLERILSIWEERGVYAGTLISELRSGLIKEESPPETPVEQKTPVESKADLQSKIVAEFVPQALIDQLAKYKKSLADLDMREKQQAAMRVDICSSEALKKLKDKAGGKKFSKDFEEGNTQLQEFVKYFDKQSKTGPPLMEALTNADIFYEMQYKEVKIVANAYQTFANRVLHLKRKLDSLKATLPDLDESPIPSPSADAPSPTGSESPFHGMDLADPDPDLDGSAMDDEAEPPAPSPLSSLGGGSPRDPETVGQKDNREVEDMELSEEEIESGGIIVEQQTERPTHQEVATPAPANKEPPAATEQPVAQVTPPVVAPAASVESVDLGKIGSILNSLSSVIKNAGPLVESPPAASPAVTPVISVASQDASSLVKLLSKVDVIPSDLLGALSKVQGKSGFAGISSTLSIPAANVSSVSSITGKIPPSSTAALAAPPQSPSLSSAAPVPSTPSSSVKQSTISQVPPQTSNRASALVQALHRDMDLTTEPEPSKSSKSLESKIHRFLRGNSAFSAFDLGFAAKPAGGDNVSPVTGTDTRGGTPVRDEGGGTPTQDEIMDTPVVPFTSNSNQLKVGETVETAPAVSQSRTQKNLSSSQQQAHFQQGVAQNGQAYQQPPSGQQEMSAHGITASVAHFQQFSAQTGGLVPGERAPGSTGGSQAVGGFQGMNDRSWYSDIFPEGSSQQPRGYNVAVPGGPGENKTSGLYQYQTEHTGEPQGFASQQGASMTPGFFRGNLPPVPQLPPPPRAYDAPPLVTSSPMIPPDHHQGMNRHGDGPGARPDSSFSGMVVHDHQHKSMFHSDESELDRPHHPEDLHHHRDNLHYQEEQEWYQDDPHRQDFNQFEEDPFQEDPFHHPEDQYHRPGSPSHHYPRGQGINPPPSEDPYFSHDYQRHSPPHPPHYLPRGPPPPHLGLRHPHRPPHPAHHPHPRGPPRAPFPRFHGPNPRLRGKRPGPRGGGGHPGPMFPPKRPFPPPRY